MRSFNNILFLPVKQHVYIVFHIIAFVADSPEIEMTIPQAAWQTYANACD